MTMVSFLLVSIIQTDLVYANACYGCNPGFTNSTVLQEALNEKRLELQSQQLKQNEEQHTQDSQIIMILIAITIALGCAVIALAIVFLKTRKYQNDRN